MFKNVASQQIVLLAIDTATNTPKTGDAANITAYLSKDYGTVTVLGDTTATEMDATNAPGLYKFDVTQTESNCDVAVFSGKSSTSGVRIVPVTVFMRAPNATLLSIDGSGRVDVAKIAGTAQTARDIGASVLLSSGTGTGQVSLSSGAVIVQSGTGTGQISLSSGKVLLQETQTGVTIPTVTNLTNAPTAGDFTATMKSSITTAATAATPIAASVSGNVGGNVVGSVGSVVGAVGSVTGNVGGNVTGSVGSIATGGIVAASFATDSITSTALAASAVSEIQSGLSTYAGGDTAGTTTLLSRLTATRSGYIDNMSGGAVMLASSYTAPLDAAGVRSAVGLASANLDAQLADLPTAAENTTAVWAAATRSLTDKAGFSLATAPPTADENAAALLDLANAIESGLTVRQAMRLIVAAEAAKTSGGGGTTFVIRDLADTKDRIVATVDSSGNRTSITRDLT